MKTAEEYRARVIQLESFIARLSLVHQLTDDERAIYEHVQKTSIALTEDRGLAPSRWQKVTPLEAIVASQQGGEEPR